jgi:hypothetical protein
MGFWGFGDAQVFEFTSLETKKLTAAKVITKSTLIKARAKQKVRKYLTIV